jgi:hypothetical protein
MAQHLPALGQQQAAYQGFILLQAVPEGQQAELSTLSAPALEERPPQDANARTCAMATGAVNSVACPPGCFGALQIVPKRVDVHRRRVAVQEATASGST